MSGHSKWANIRRQKEKTDAKKGKIFTKLGREIAVAVKQGGADPQTNTKLYDVVAKAKAANMPNDTILRSIKKASGDVNNDNYEDITYEGYGPGGVAVIVEAMTDNRNRTAGDVRHFFDKFGGNLGTAGCVSFMFNKRGVIIIERKDGMDEDQIMMDALEAGAEDFAAEDEYFEVATAPEDFTRVCEALEKKGLEFVEAEVKMVPATMTKLTEQKQKDFMERLIENLEDLDDVMDVYHNWDEDEE